MGAIVGSTGAAAATALVVPRAVTPVAPVPPRRRGGTTIGDTVGPEDAAYTIIDDPLATLTASRRARARRLSAGAPPRASASSMRRWGVRDDALRAYTPYQDYLGLYVDLWV